MEAIKFNFPPSVAKRYVDEWKKQVEGDKEADDRIKKVMQDVCTLCDLAVKHLKFEPETPVKES